LRKKPQYGASIGSGVESVVRPVLNRKEKVVHKVFRLPWISQHYYMGGNINYISRLAHTYTIPIRDMQPPKKGRRGLQTVPREHWEKISFLLAAHSANVAAEVKRLGIKTPKVFRPVSVKGESGHFWVVEMSDLRRKDRVLVEGPAIYDIHKTIPNLPPSVQREIAQKMSLLESQITSSGFAYDDRHKRYGSWLVSINPKTNAYELIFTDATNWRDLRTGPQAPKTS